MDIRHYQFQGNPEEFEQRFREYLRGELKGMISRDLFILKYLRPHLGPELNRMETKGKRVIRVYYDNTGSITHMKIYDPEYLKKHRWPMELHFFDVDEDILEPARPRSEIRSSCERYSPDPPKIDPIIARSRGETLELKAEMVNLLKNVYMICDHLLCRRIPKTRFDTIPLSTSEGQVCAQPFTSSGTWNIEGLLYARGYKTVARKNFDPDGVVFMGDERIYDEEGRLIRIEYYQETPWGERIIWEVREWRFELKRRLICQRVYTPGRKVDTIYRYQLDEKDRVGEIRRYCLPEKAEGLGLRDPYTPEGMVFDDKTEFTYDGERLVMEKNLNLGKWFYNYDQYGRLMTIKSYDWRGRKVCTTLCRYPAENQVEKIRRYKDFDPKEEKLMQD